MLNEIQIFQEQRYRMYNNESSRVYLEILEKLYNYLDCEPSDLFVYTKETD